MGNSIAHFGLVQSLDGPKCRFYKKTVVREYNVVQIGLKECDIRARYFFHLVPLEKVGITKDTYPLLVHADIQKIFKFNHVTKNTTYYLMDKNLCNGFYF